MSVLSRGIFLEVDILNSFPLGTISEKQLNIWWPLGHP